MNHIDEILHRVETGAATADDARELWLTMQKAYVQGHVDRDSRPGEMASEGWQRFCAGVRPGGMWPFGEDAA